MPKGPQPIVIDNFQKGIADSNFLGFADMQGVDITTIPGAAQINYLTTKASSTTITGKPIQIVADVVQQVLYCVDTDGKVYKSTNSGTGWSLVSGNTTGDANVGLCVWKNYLFSFRSAAIDVYGPLSSSPSWSNSWNSFADTGGVHPSLWGQDDIMYAGSKNKILSLAEVSGKTFAPGDGTTFTLTTAALTLPAFARVSCLAELGVNLMIGTYAGGVPYVNKIADIYPWDRTSTTFRLPIRLKEFGITSMLTYNNQVYFTAGERGAIYVTNGYSVQLLKELYKPMQHLSTGVIRLNLNYPFSMMVHKNKIYFGVSAINPNVGPQGVWSLDPVDNTLNFEHQISTGVTLATTIDVPCLYSSGNDAYLIGWQDSTNTAQGIDIVDVTARYTSYTAFIDTAFYHVGVPDSKREFDKVIINLAQPLATGQGVKLFYRTAVNGSFAAFTSEGPFDYATYPSFQSIAQTTNSPVSLENIQFRILLTTAGSSTTTPILQSIMIT